MIELLAQIDNNVPGPKGWCAGIVLWDDKVVATAPILRKWFAGKTRAQVREICARQGWKITVVYEQRRAAQRAGREYR